METHTTDTTWKRSPLQVLRSHLNCSLDVNCSPELQTADRNLQLVDNEAYNTDGAVTPRESLPSTQVSANQPSASRHKPSRRQKLPLSATARHLDPWVSAKTQLIELQMQLIQKQQEREHAAEKREQQLFKLKKECLELKIEIRKEKLKKIISG